MPRRSQRRRKRDEDSGGEPEAEGDKENLVRDKLTHAVQVCMAQGPFWVAAAWLLDQYSLEFGLNNMLCPVLP